MRPFKVVIDHPVYWSLNRRSVTRAFALGLFISFVPIPVHLILGTALALLFRLNVPAAVAGTFLANPFTMVPMYLGAYWVGCHLLGVRERAVAFEMTFQWLTTTLIPIWKPFLLGCLILGTLSALIGYAIVGGAWHIGLVLKYHKRKSSSAQKESQAVEKRS